MAGSDEQAAWKAKADPIQQEMRRLRAQLARAPEEQKAKLEADLEKLDESMPDPLASIYTVKDDAQQATPIHLLSRDLFRVSAHDEVDLVRGAIDLGEQALQINRPAGAGGGDHQFHGPNQSHSAPEHHLRLIISRSTRN